MKKYYLLIIFTLAAFISNAQSKTWIGADNGLWSEPTNWSPEGTPYNNDDVLIPSGTTILIDGQADADTVTVETGAIMNLSGTDDYPEFVYSTLIIESGAELNFQEGNIIGNVNVYGTMNVIGDEQKEIWYGIQNIYGIVNIPNNGELGLRNTEFVITPEGECIIENSGSIYVAAFTADFRNEGLIEKNGTDTFTVSTFFENLDADIEVDGILEFSTISNLTNGVYNVSEESAINFLSTVYLTGTLTGELNGPFRTEGSLSANEDNMTMLNFTGFSYYDWAGGTLSFGNLTNNSHLKITGEASLDVQIGACSLINNSILDIISTEQIWLYTSLSAIVNTPTGVLNLQVDNLISGGTTYNEGLIKKHNSYGTTTFNNLENTNGTIQVETGEIHLVNGATFSDGIYNVFPNASLLTTTGTTTYLEGTLTGTLDGPWEVYSALNTPESTMSFFNFDGESVVHWYSGNISGGGTLVNQSKMDVIHVESSATQILQNTTLQNEAAITMFEDSYITMSNNGRIHNTTSGTIELKSNVGISQLSASSILNEGLIKKTEGDDLFNLYVALENNMPGYIQSESGEIKLNNIIGNGSYSGTSLIDLLASYTIEGFVSPGGELGSEIGTLTFSNGYNSGAASTMKINIDGPIAGDEYDRVEVTGDALVSGDIDIELNFSPAIEDEFMILSASGTVTCEGLPTLVTGTFEGLDYTFDVICNDNNITLKTLSVGIEEIESDISISLFPIPMNDHLTIRLSENIKSKNATITLTNSIGQIAKEIQVARGISELQIDRERISSGIYQLSLSTEKGIILTEKFIVQ